MFTKLLFLASLLLNTVSLHLRGTDNIPYITKYHVPPFRQSQSSYYNLTREVHVQPNSQHSLMNTVPYSSKYQ